ncbi:hypothetical protein Bbelb_368300 [Branchiostoma belcheri]|nr:hypothetical protein Bbelb_368300 [Branchiostoma belcheri]
MLRRKLSKILVGSLFENNGYCDMNIVRHRMSDGCDCAATDTLVTKFQLLSLSSRRLLEKGPYCHPINTVQRTENTVDTLQQNDYRPAGFRPPSPRSELSVILTPPGATVIQTAPVDGTPGHASPSHINQLQQPRLPTGHNIGTGQSFSCSFSQMPINSAYEIGQFSAEAGRGDQKVLHAVRNNGSLIKNDGRRWMRWSMSLSCSEKNLPLVAFFNSPPLIALLNSSPPPLMALLNSSPPPTPLLNSSPPPLMALLNSSPPPTHSPTQLFPTPTHGPTQLFPTPHS